MAIHVVKGNLLNSDCNVIIHQANSMGVMGAGIARQIVNLYPEVLAADRAYKVPVGSTQRLGRTSHAWVNGPHGRLLVVNLYGQHKYGRGLHTNYEALVRGFDSIFKRVSEMKRDTKVGLPYGMGAGLSGGNWKTVSAIIEKAAREHSVDVYLYKL